MRFEQLRILLQMDIQYIYSAYCKIEKENLTYPCWSGQRQTLGLVKKTNN